MRSGSKFRIISVLFASYMQVSPLACQEPLIWCARDLEDVNTSGNWIRNNPAVWNYAPTTNDLPEVLRTRISGDGIFWTEGSDNVYTSFYLNPQINPRNNPMYLYVKYYVHAAANTAERFGVFPGKKEYFTLLPISRPYDFAWREALIEIDVDYVAFNRTRVGVEAVNLKRNQYLLIDKMVIVQGLDIQSPEQASALCTPKRPITFECINSNTAFVTDNWQSSRPYSYTASASQLPDSIKANVSSTGIFYTEGNGEELFTIGKDYSVHGRLPPGEAFVYFRYMTILAEGTNVKVAAAAAGFDINPDSNLTLLPLSPKFDWAEVLLPLRYTENLVEIQVQNLQPSEFFLVDKIAVVAGGGMGNVLTDVALCRNRVL